MEPDEKLPELPPAGHPLQKLGARLAELLDEDHWAECERLLLEGWAHDELDRKTGRHWRENSSLEVWFPITAEELGRAREALQCLAEGGRKPGHLTKARVAEIARAGLCGPNDQVQRAQ